MERERFRRKIDELLDDQTLTELCAGAIDMARSNPKVFEIVLGIMGEKPADKQAAERELPFEVNIRMAD